eukprot:6188269-Pleurochrysis_carterae.AAC.2
MANLKASEVRKGCGELYDDLWSLDDGTLRGTPERACVRACVAVRALCVRACVRCCACVRAARHAAS